MRCLGSPGGLVLSRLVGNSLGFGFEEWVVGVGVESCVLTVVGCCQSQAVVGERARESYSSSHSHPRTASTGRRGSYR